MSPNLWGPPLWNFLHTVSINISEEGYSILGKEFFNILFRICKNLPCPECAGHASSFMQKVNPNTLRKKVDMINMLYLFHNSVNKRKMKPMFHYSFLRKYETISVIEAYNMFVSTFITNSSRLMNENLQRKMLVSQIKQWLVKNIKYFIKPSPPPPSPTNKLPKEEDVSTNQPSGNEIINEPATQEDFIPEKETPEISEPSISENIQMNITELTPSEELLKLPHMDELNDDVPLNVETSN
jgi:Erv1 / Alr family